MTGKDGRTDQRCAVRLDLLSGVVVLKSSACAVAFSHQQAINTLVLRHYFSIITVKRVRRKWLRLLREAPATCFEERGLWRHHFYV